jgi:hypothetical protein
VDSIQKAEVQERIQVAKDIILKGCIVSTADRFGEQLFGVPSFPSWHEPKSIGGYLETKIPQLKL